MYISRQHYERFYRGDQPVTLHALFTDQALFRPRLERIIDAANPRTMAVGMQNPSTAEADATGKNDPTISRLISFGKQLGYGRLIVFNPHTRRASKPDDLYRWYESITLGERGTYKIEALQAASKLCAEAETVIAASGNCYLEDAWIREFWRMIGEKYPLFAFDLTGHGVPKHPLARGKARIADPVSLKPWRPRS